MLIEQIKQLEERGQLLKFRVGRTLPSKAEFYDRSGESGYRRFSFMLFPNPSDPADDGLIAMTDTQISLVVKTKDGKADNEKFMPDRLVAFSGFIWRKPKSRDNICPAMIFRPYAYFDAKIAVNFIDSSSSMQDQFYAFLKLAMEQSNAWEVYVEVHVDYKDENEDMYHSTFCNYVPRDVKKIWGVEVGRPWSFDSKNGENKKINYTCKRVIRLFSKDTFESGVYPYDEDIPILNFRNFLNAVLVRRDLITAMQMIIWLMSLPKPYYVGFALANVYYGVKNEASANVTFHFLTQGLNEDRIKMMLNGDLEGFDWAKAYTFEVHGTSISDKDTVQDDFIKTEKGAETVESFIKQFKERAEIFRNNVWEEQ